MAGIKNCPVCGKLYLDNPHKMCPDCLAKEQEMERVVADYVRDNFQANVKEIVEGTGVPEKIVIKMIREGRFVESKYPISYPCQSCGAPITHGKVCKKCSSNFMDQVEKMNAKQAEKMDRSHTMAMMRGR